MSKTNLKEHELETNEVQTEMSEKNQEEPIKEVDTNEPEDTLETFTAKIYANAHSTFLSQYTIQMVQDELKQYVLGQDELVKHVATFIYYHILRQMNKNLNIRPLLISGPSGSGKTEIWRAAKKVFDKYLRIEIVDGSTITQSGWSGQRKFSSILRDLDTATILVIDEFDKLAAPAHSKGGENVSHHIQAECLKLLEGDYNTTGFRRDADYSDEIRYDASTLGIVLVGAFEGIRSDKENRKERIGFSGETRNKAKYEALVPITDEDLIKFGVLPELVGRISDKCTVNKLTAQQYLEIIKNQHSRVSVLVKELEKLGIDAAKAIDDDKIIQLAEKSQSNMLGVRWVSSQIENMLLDLLVTADLRDKFEPIPIKLTRIVQDIYEGEEYEVPFPV